MRINKEGYKIIGISGAVCVFLWWLIYHLLVSDANISLLWVSAVLLLLFWFFIVAFFREPRRVRIHERDRQREGSRAAHADRAERRGQDGGNSGKYI